MKQRSPAKGGFEKCARSGRRAEASAPTHRVVPGRELCEVIEPHDPKAGNGTPPVGMQRMLGIYVLHHANNLRDPDIEE